MVILGLGSNKGDRAAVLAQAVVELTPLLGSVRASRLYETKALLPDGAPPSWDIPFLNMAVMGETALSPEALLTAVKHIETALGRCAAERWAPREIDIDILAMGNVLVAEPALNIPHAALLTRDFALLPLAEIAPDWCYPGIGKYQGWKAADIVTDKGYSPGTLKEKGIAVYG